jgi:cob(I)alamin adenosyltransferase
MRGYVQVYTGDGKGKTTAALGLAIRAVGAGLRVFIAQFVKGMEYSELKALRKFSDSIVVRQYARDCFLYREPEETDREFAGEGLQEVQEVVAGGQYDLVILDEANIATYFNLFSVEDLLELIRRKADKVEIVITGRRADARLIEAADLVTEMKEVKHYYQKGVQARDGIER